MCIVVKDICSVCRVYGLIFWGCYIEADYLGDKNTLLVSAFYRTWSTEERTTEVRLPDGRNVWC